MSRAIEELINGIKIDCRIDVTEDNMEGWRQLLAESLEIRDFTASSIQNNKIAVGDELLYEDPDLGFDVFYTVDGIEDAGDGMSKYTLSKPYLTSKQESNS